MRKMQLNVIYRNMEVRRFSKVNAPINISNNSTLTGVRATGNKLSVSFVFSSNYEPNVGLIRIEGELEFEESRENIKRAVDEWEKSEQKNLPEELAEKVHNSIISNCMVEATLLSREVQLPTPIPPFHLSINKKDAAYSDTGSYIR